MVYDHQSCLVIQILILQEMNLLVEADQPGNDLDGYISRLNAILSQKAAAIYQLQNHLLHFQKRLKEHNVLVSSCDWWTCAEMQVLVRSSSGYIPRTPTWGCVACFFTYDFHGSVLKKLDIQLRFLCGHFLFHIPQRIQYLQNLLPCSFQYKKFVIFWLQDFFV